LFSPARTWTGFHRRIFRTLILSLLSVWLVLFVLVPNLLVVGLSFLNRDSLGSIDWRFTFDNYQRLLDPIYLRVFLHSFGLALSATLLCLVLGYPFAYGMARARTELRPLLLTLVIIPFWTNSLIRIYAIRGLLAVKGILNAGLISLGIVDEPLRLLYTSAAELLGLVYILLPFMILPLYGALEKLDPRLLEAARDLGAGAFRTLFHVILPLTLPGIVAGCLLVFLPALGLFYVSDVLGGARSLLVGNLLKDQFLDAQDWPFGSAASVVMIVLLFSFLLTYAWAERRFSGAGSDRME
jgi:spermidine/putrescine transport system permease protein